MPIFLAFIWEKVPVWFRWLTVFTVLIIWAPLAARDWFFSTIQEQAEASMVPYKTDQKHKDEIVKLKLDTLHEDIKFIKYYVQYKKAPIASEPKDD
jgi:hypothetical protein